MTKIRDLFNTVAQGVKDTINGFDYKSFWGVAHIGATGFMTAQTVALVSAGIFTIGTGLSAVFAGAMIANAHYNGRQQRLAGMAPRYVS